jgi:dipeptidyl aminopeptidase/acylaminoacyl peptidase
MRIRGWLLVLVLAPGFAAPAAAAPLEAYGGLPSIESVEISPDGSKLAVALSTAGQRMLAIKTLPAGPVQTYGVGAAKVRRLDWVGSQRVIITTSQTRSIAEVVGPRREWMLGFELDLATGKTSLLLNRVTTGGSGTGGTIIPDRSADKVTASLNVLAGPPEVYVVAGTPTLFLRGITFRENRGVLTILKVDPKTRKTDLVALGLDDTDDYILDQEGIPLARADYDDKSGKWTLSLRRDLGWKVSRTLEAKIDPPVLAGLGRDGRSVVVGEMTGTGFQVREVAADGTWGEPLEVRDVDSMIHDPLTHRLIGYYALVGDEDRYTFFDPADQKAWNAVQRAFKGDRVQLESWSQDRTKIVVLADSPTQGPGYALVDMTTKRASWLGARYQKLTERDISPVRPIRFKAKDGRS